MAPTCTWSLPWVIIFVAYTTAISIYPAAVYKRSGTCEPYEPFQCPSGECIPIRFLCDGSPDCGDMYDEDENMCSALRRPPMQTTEHLLLALLRAHGPDFLVNVFGRKAASNMEGMGGVHNVAVGLTEIPTAGEFAKKMGMLGGEAKIFKENMVNIVAGETGDMGLSGRESADLRFYITKLSETGFLDK